MEHSTDQAYELAIREDERRQCIAELRDPENWQLQGFKRQFLDILSKKYIERGEWVGACARLLERGLAKR